MSLADQSAYQVGHIVALRANPERRGAVIEVRLDARENQYGVFLDGRKQLFYESQLAAAPEETEEDPQHVALDEFHARLTALELIEPGLESLYSLQSGRIDFIPYQFRPVLKFIKADRPRLLIADEVGVGKTIEAGLIIRELQARQRLQTIMIVCSKALVVEQKWHNEMRRFDEDFIALDGPTLRHCLAETDRDGEWPRQYPRTIVPYSLFSEELVLGRAAEGRQSRPGLATLEPPPRIDLLIVDEAHNARNTETNLYQGLKVLADNADAVVFLTATPIQLGNRDLYTLLNLLRPDLVIDRFTFEQMSEPNPHLNAAIAAARGAATNWETVALESLHEAANTRWGNSVLAKGSDFQDVQDTLSRAPLNIEQRVRLIDQIELLHSFAFVISRTRRRDIGKFTTRKPRTEAVEFTPEQAQLHNLLLDVQARILERIHGSGPIAFLMSTIRRQAASCIHGLAPYIETILARRLKDIEAVEIDSEYPELDPRSLDSLHQDIQIVLKAAQHLSNNDPKVERLLDIIREKSSLPNNKLLIFSSFRHTIAYIEKHLKAAGVPFGVVHGDVDQDLRRDLRAAFARPKDHPQAIDILISSEVGSEGLDYQFCDGLVNYDIPWNPMRVEQRIGRIDRYGQQSEAVAIYNLVTPGTIDFTIYDRCMLRIGVFEQSIGGNEQILGDIGRQIRHVAEDLSLTPAEQDARLRQLGDNEIRLIAEQQNLETRESELFGLSLSKDQMAQEIEDASNFWLTPESLQRLVAVYLSNTFGNDRMLAGHGPVRTLRLSAEARRTLLPERRPSHTLAGLADRAWEKWLLGDRPTISLAFSQKAAVEDPSTALIGPTHPLIQQSAKALAEDVKTLSIALRIGSPKHRPGSYPFAIYHWRFHGIREDSQLVAVVVEQTIAKDFISLLARASEVKLGSLGVPSAAILDDLKSQHLTDWRRRRDAHRADTAERAQVRRESLAASHLARLVLLREQCDSATDERIRRMRTTQLAQVESDHERSLTTLAKAESSAEITFRLVALGTLEVDAVDA